MEYPDRCGDCGNAILNCTCPSSIAGAIVELSRTNLSAGVFTLTRFNEFDCGVVTEEKTGHRYLSLSFPADDVNLSQVITFDDESLEYIKEFIRRKGL